METIPYTKTKENLRHVILEGLVKDSKDVFKLGFNDQGQLIKITRQERGWDGLRKTVSEGRHPYSQEAARDYFLRHGVILEVYPKNVLFKGWHQKEEPNEKNPDDFMFSW